MTTIANWLAKYPEFIARYAHAREIRAEHYASEIIEIADEVPVTEQPDPDGRYVIRIDGGKLAWAKPIPLDAHLINAKDAKQLAEALHYCSESMWRTDELCDRFAMLPG